MRSLPDLRTVGWFTAIVTLLVLLPLPAAHSQDSADAPVFAVVVRSTGDANDETARDLQEILIAAFSGRGHFRMIGKDELLVQGGFAGDAPLVTCLIDEACVSGLRQRLNIKVLVLGKIDSSATHHEFSIERFSDLPDPYTKVVKVKQAAGIDGLLDALYSIAEEMPLEDPRATVTPTPVEPDVKQDTGTSGDVHTEPLTPVRPADPRPPVEQGGLGAPAWLSIGSGVLSLASLSVALYFNGQVIDAKDELSSDIAAAEIRAGGAQGLSRARAKRLEGTVNDNAVFANVFYGVSAGMVSLSALFAFLEVVATDEDAPAGATLSPILAPDLAGAALRLDF